MLGCESENCTDPQNTQTSIQTSTTFGLDLSVAGNSSATVSVPVVVKMDPDSPSNDVNIEDATPELSNSCETVLVKPEPSDDADINTTTVKIEPPCDPQECTSGGVVDGDLQSLGKSTCGTQTTTTASNSFTSGNVQHCTGGPVFCTPQMTTAASSSFTFGNNQHRSGGPVSSTGHMTNSTSSNFTFGNRHHSARPVFSTPQMTTAAPNSFTFRTSQHCSGGPVFSTPQMCTATACSFTFGNSQHCSGQSNFGMPQMTTTESNNFGTPQTPTTDRSDFIFSVPLNADSLWNRLLCGGYNRRVSENPFFRSSRSIPVRVQNPSAAGNPQTATTAPCCNCFSFFSSPRCGCSHHFSRSGGFPFGSASQRQQTKTASDSSQPPSTLPHTAVTTATVSSSSSSSPVFSACLDSMQQHVWGKRLFPTAPQPVSSAPERAYTGASSPQIVCSSVVSASQTKLCFGVPGMKLPSTVTHTEQPSATTTTTTGSPSCSTTTASHGGQHPKSFYLVRRKRRNQCGYEYRGHAKHRREVSGRNNMRNISEGGSSHRDATVISNETGEDRTSHSERPLNLTASDFKVVIIPVDYPDVRLSEDAHVELQLALIEEMFSSKDRLLPQFSACCFEGGALVLKCKTDNAKDWLIAILPNLKSWKGANLKVGDYKDYLFSTRVSLKTPPAMTTRSPHSVLRLIKKQNKDLDTDQWKLLSSVEQDRGRILHLSLDPAAVQDLKSRGCNIFLGLEQILVKIYDR